MCSGEMIYRRFTIQRVTTADVTCFHAGIMQLAPFKYQYRAHLCKVKFQCFRSCQHCSARSFQCHSHFRGNHPLIPSSPMVFLIGRIARLHGLQPNFYADDTQLYATFSPSTPVDDTNTHTILETCLGDMQQWMVENFLKFNAHKTQFLVICSQHLRHKVNIPDLHVGDALVAPCSDARNLGVLFDKSMNLDQHVLNVCQSSYVHLRRIAAIRESLTLPAAEQLILAFISSRLDFCNSLLAGLPQHTLQRLQKVQNAAARLLTRTKTSQHITPILRDLHWLPVNYRIQFKILLLTFKALHGLAPSYIQGKLQYRNLRPGLRSSSSSHILSVPKTRLATYGDRAFSSFAPRLWKSLPDESRDEKDLSSFKLHLKTHLFNLAFYQK